MKVSVIIPCHNAKRYLAQTLGSVLEQSRRPQEIIVVDDGSTDGSLALAQRFATRLPIVRVFSERSGQAARTRNLGALEATGDALMFLDADDVLAPDTLEALVEALTGQPTSIAACPWYRLDWLESRWVRRPPSCAPLRSGQDALSGWLTGWYHPPCSVLWSRAAFERAGRWSERWNPNDDGDLMMRALARGITLRESRAGAAFYRRLPEAGKSLSGARYTADGLTARLQTLTNIADLLEERGMFNTYRPALREALLRVAADAQTHASRTAVSLSESEASELWRSVWTDKRHATAALWTPRELARLSRRPDSQSRPADRWHRPMRLLGRIRSKLNSMYLRRTVPPAPVMRPDEITFGLRKANQILGTEPEASTPQERQNGEKTGAVSALDNACTQRPHVSVIIPTFNRAHLLARTLKSVVEQSFDDFEVLVVDDASHDETSEVVDSIGDARIRYLRQPENRGVAAARNRGLYESRGAFVAFLDSDDEWLPEKLRLQVDLFRRSADDVGLIYTGVESVFGDCRRETQLPSARGDLYRQLLLKNVIHGGGSNAMMRRQVVADVGFFDEELPAIEDYDYWVRISRRYRIDYVDEPLLRYHDNRSQVTDAADGIRRSRNGLANVRARDLFFQRHAAELRRLGLVHLFFLESARRSLSTAYSDPQAARRAALRAMWAKPTSPEARWMLRRTVLRTPRRQQSNVAPQREVETMGMTRKAE